jgi:ribosomal protein RSM22 (predicted rRNA methylase)
MEMPERLRMAIDEQVQGVGLNQLLHDAQAISRRYRLESGSGRRLVTSHAEAVAYAASRMPATFGAVCTALQYALDCFPGNPRSLLDAGAGTGAAAWAANAVLELAQIVCLEREPAMRQVGQALMADAGLPLETAEWHEADLGIAEYWQRQSGVMQTNQAAGRFGADLVIAAYVLGEMDAATRQSTVARLWEASGQLLLLVEPGTPEGYGQLMQARAWLLGQQAHMIAPCPQEDACPMQEGDWCHFSCRIARDRLHRQLKSGDAPYEDEKFAFLAVARQPGQPAGARILRHPRIEKGRVLLEVCRGSTLERISVNKQAGQLYKKARKSRCGDALD